VVLLSWLHVVFYIVVYVRPLPPKQGGATVAHIAQYAKVHFDFLLNGYARNWSTQS
jgi:hypothetical protein